jgi:hypothetical protein
VTRVREDMVVTLAMAAGVAAAAVAAGRLSPVARLAPLAVAVPTLVLLAAELVRQLARPTDTTSTASRAAERTMLGWVAVLLGASLVLGMTWGLPLFVLLYLRLRAGERVTVAAMAAVALWVVLFGVLSAILHVHLYDGLLHAWLMA